MNRIVLIGLCLLVPVPALAQTPTDAQVVERARAYLQPLTAELSGTLLLARGNRILLHESYGLADFEHRVPFTNTTPAVVASLTKPMTIIIAGALIDAGKLSPDDRVSKWLPEYVHGDKMTVGQLMAHTAGVPHRLVPEDRQAEPRTAEEMVRIANESALLFEPGARSSYSSGGYTLLAAVLERAGGADYDALLQQYVARPVQAKQLRHVNSRVVLADRARSVALARDVVVNTGLKDVSFLVGAGSVNATAHDMFAIIRGLAGASYTNTARTRLLRENGLRWNGITNGYRAFSDYHLPDSVTVVFVGNAHTAPIDLLRRELPRIARGESVTHYAMPQVTPVALSESARARLEGTYDTGGGSPAKLVFVSPMTAMFGDRILTASSDSTMFSWADHSTLVFESDAEGKVTVLAWGPGTWTTTGDQGPRFQRVADK